ncbi:MAG: ABC transporter permease [Cyanobacteria bacterium CRU_2_1]|nr:ABC transporter permease [Cyanobacteria bacterium RU_5_0]NJR57702.1 ABC transporter permease [Cyanobacteria bacterium CRU_2_1]
MGIIFANIIAIYRRELQSYFASPFAYIVAGVFWLLSGFFFIAIFGTLVQQSIIQDQYGIPTPFDVSSEILGAFLGVLSSLVLFVMPMLSMGLYSEERKRGTLELLATSPITNWAVALGKLLGVVTFFATMVLPLLLYEVIAFSASNPPIQPTVLAIGHVGLILLAAAILSLGMFISSLTDSTVLAAILTFALALLLWVIDFIADRIGGTIGGAIGHLSLLKNYNLLAQGILDTSTLVLFASYVILGLFLTAQSIEAFRFQRS